MIKPEFTGNAVRASFIKFFEDKGHTFVPSSSLVPGGDATLLFTNAGMVQFKDIFLGKDKRAYTRAANSQKCVRVAGKHNDLEDVGRDDTHHTFFEMLGNWSFGDYYKKEAIEWAWELLTEVWNLPEDKLWATCFEDEFGEIPRDDEAADYWRSQPGINPEQVLFFGRKENFWEMADTGPNGPCSEIHIDRGIHYCNMMQDAEHICQVNGDCQRFLELWNLVFIQYNRLSPTHLEPLPATHVDTGLGFDRLVSLLQDVDSNYRTDLLFPLITATQKLAGHTDEERERQFTPYRAIADHARAASFLIADGVVPGNLGRNYVCRMIIRRAFRFGGQINLFEPFLANIARTVIEQYGGAYPELVRNQSTILSTITREEEQFLRTLNKATGHLEDLLFKLENEGKKTLSGEIAANLYSTYGMPLEITRDIAKERNLNVDEVGFKEAMNEHRLISGAGKAMGSHGGDDVEIYRKLFEQLREQGHLGPDGVKYSPYGKLEFSGEVLAIIGDQQSTDDYSPGDSIDIVLPKTHFYIESGGQVSDSGSITGDDWSVRIKHVRQPAAGIIVQTGEITFGKPKIGDQAIAKIDRGRRLDIMRNHTATHLLHAALREVLGQHARQAGSLVAPDRLRFDFTHPEAVSPDQVTKIENTVNQRILENHHLNIAVKSFQQAIDEGATALFGEKYAQNVRTITIGDDILFSYELCGGTHVENTSDIGVFVITNEGSVAAGIRRIEALSGREAYKFIQNRFNLIKQTARILSTTPDQISEKARNLVSDLNNAKKQVLSLQSFKASKEIEQLILQKTTQIGDVQVLVAELKATNETILRQLADEFRRKYPQNGIMVSASVINKRPIIVSSVTKDLVERGIKADDLVRFVAKPLGGGGGGKPTLAQAGGKDPSKLRQVLKSVPSWIEKMIQSQ